MKPTRADFTAAFMRSFAIQGSWNLKTMIGGGLVFALAPLLRRIHSGNPVALGAALRRHASPFNAHPYLSTVALGALARLEHDGESPETLERFRTALRAPLGALGDEAIWAGWRPFCALVTILAYELGLDARVAALAFLLLYNVVHVGLRWWGLRLGWRAGLGVGAALTASPLRRISRRVRLANEALLGAAFVLLAAGLPGGETGPWVEGVAAAAGVGAFLAPGVGGTVGILALFAACALWLAG